MDFDWTDGPLAEGLRLYNAGEFFAAHEAWESVWLAAPEPQKTFLQGVIQISAALHHLQRGNNLGAARLLQGALRRLEPCCPPLQPPGFGGIDVAQLCDAIHARLNALNAGVDPALVTPPPIEPLP